MEKDILRKKYICKRQQYALKEVSLMSQVILDKLIKTKEYKDAKSIFTYVSVKNEVDTIFLILKALEDNKKVAVPKTYKKGKMEFFYINSLDNLKISNFGLLEPTQANHLAIPDHTTLIIVPGLVFDYSCNRIGFGAGYYDQYLQKYLEIPKIGLAFDEQIIDLIPIDEHDIPLDSIMTDKKQYLRK